MTSKIVITVTDTGEGFLINQRSIIGKTSTSEEAKQANLMMYWMVLIIEQLGGCVNKIEEVKDE